MIDKLGSLMTQAVTRVRRTAGHVAGEGASSRRGADDPSRPPASLSRQLEQRILALDPDDPERRRKVLSAYIEYRLLKDLGGGLRNEAQFHSVVVDVVSVMESTPELRPDIDRVVDQLLEPTPGQTKV